MMASNPMKKTDIPRTRDTDELILNYQDACCVYGRDLDLLRQEQSWLNDTILHYWLIRLQETYRPHHQHFSGNNNNDDNDNDGRFVILDPIVVSYLIHQLDIDDLDECRQMGQTYHHGFHSNTARLLLPINDTMVPGTLARSHSPLGTHWSLLVMDIMAIDSSDSDNDHHESKMMLCGYHLDSMMIMGSDHPHHHHQSGNFHCAQAVANQFQRLLHRIRNRNDEQKLQQQQPVKHLKNVQLQNVPVPQQTNGYDCGIHVLLNAETIIQETYSSFTTSSTIPPPPSPWRTNPEYFHKQQQTRLEQRDFSVVERRKIALDIMEQCSRTTHN